jgi:hypothetical protein
VAFFLRRSLLYIKEDKIRESIFRKALEGDLWWRPPPTRFYVEWGDGGDRKGCSELFVIPL